MLFRQSAALRTTELTEINRIYTQNTQQLTIIQTDRSLKHVHSHMRVLILFTYDKERLAPLTCHKVHQTLKPLSNSVNTKARKYDIKIARPTK